MSGKAQQYILSIVSCHSEKTLHSEMDKGRKSPELRSQRWQWMLASETEIKQTDPDGDVSWRQGLVAKAKGSASELTLDEVNLLPKVQHNLMQEVTFHEKLLPPPQKPLTAATFDFVAQHQEVTASGDGRSNYLGAKVTLQNVKINWAELGEKLAAIQYQDFQFVDYLRFG